MVNIYVWLNKILSILPFVPLHISQSTNMWFSSVLLLTGAASAAYLGYYQDSTGQEKLIGSNFGNYGANATFDYVVSLEGASSAMEILR